MHRISAKQNYLLKQLGEQGKRIERLSKIEHDLIKEVHPQVNEIKEGMEEMIATAKENQEDRSDRVGSREHKLRDCPRLNTTSSRKCIRRSTRSRKGWKR